MKQQTTTSRETPSAGEMPWVLVRAGQGLFALSTRFVHEMVSVPPVTIVPLSPEFVRGAINLRGQVMPLVDLRLRFGLGSQAQDTERLVELLGAREQDHRRWVAELTACVREKRKFTLTTDPHQCAFGKWYDNFKTENLLLETVLKCFDAPHQRIHAIGREVVEMMEAGDCTHCEALLTDGQARLEALVKLFRQAESELRESNREVAVVLKGAGPLCGIVVDAIESVERLPEETMSAVDDSLVDVGMCSQFIDAIAHRPRDGSLVLTLHAASLLGGATTA